MVCDTLEGFDANVIDAFWGSPALSGAIVERVKEVSNEFFSGMRSANELFCLFVPSSVNRVHEFALNDWPDAVPLLALDPDDLETIARVEAGNSLVLWKFAQKTTEMLGKMRLISRRMSFEVYDRLQALAAMLTIWGSSSDALHFGLSDVSLSVSRARRILIHEPQYSMAMMVQLGGLAADRLIDCENVFRKHMGEHMEPAESDFENSELGRATRAEFGHSLLELTNFLIALGDIAIDLKPTTPAIMERGALIAKLAKELQWDVAKVEHCLDLFSLAPRENYLKPPSLCRKEDLYPWRFNREISYLRRPLLTRVQDGMTEMLWGHRHVDMVRFYLVQLCASTRLKAKSPEMRSVLAGYRHEAGRRFNDAAYEALRQLPHLIVAKNMHKIGALNMGHLGDVDILCADLNETVLWVIECKSLALARTPYEMRKELELLNLNTEDQTSTIAKHEARSAWVKHHLPLVLNWLGADPGRNWTVRPLIVMETIPISPLLRDVSIPIISLDMLKKKLERTKKPSTAHGQ